MEIRNARCHIASRVEPDESLDFFPTPPWAVRALFHHVLGTTSFRSLIVDEPACGEGHMAYPLQDFFGTVRASDIHPYGYGEVLDFLRPGPWRADEPAPHWIISNPPFGEKALAFMLLALKRALEGVAMLLPTRYVEGITRYGKLYRSNPPTVIAHFVERVPIHRGRWVVDGDSAAAYSWFIWRHRASPRPPVWIPPCRAALMLRRDVAMFGASASIGGSP